MRVELGVRAVSDRTIESAASLGRTRLRQRIGRRVASEASEPPASVMTEAPTRWTGRKLGLERPEGAGIVPGEMAEGVGQSLPGLECIAIDVARPWALRPVGDRVEGTRGTAQAERQEDVVVIRALPGVGEHLDQPRCTLGSDLRSLVLGQPLEVARADEILRLLDGERLGPDFTGHEEPENRDPRQGTAEADPVSQTKRRTESCSRFRQQALPTAIAASEF